MTIAQKTVSETYEKFKVPGWKSFSLLMKLLKKHGEKDFLEAREYVEANQWRLENPMTYFLGLLLKKEVNERGLEKYKELKKDLFKVPA